MCHFGIYHSREQGEWLKLSQLRLELLVNLVALHLVAQHDPPVLQKVVGVLENFLLLLTTWIIVMFLLDKRKVGVRPIGHLLLQGSDILWR